MPSLATQNAGEFATGPHDIDIDPLGFALVTIGFGGDPTKREAMFGPDGPRFARELLLLPRDNRLVVKDLGLYEDPPPLVRAEREEILVKAGAVESLQVVGFVGDRAARSSRLASRSG